MATRPGWLADLLGYFSVRNSAGTPFAQRSTIQFGSGFTVTDNASTGRTEVGVNVGAIAASAYQVLTIGGSTSTWAIGSGVNARLANTLTSGLIVNLTGPTNGQGGRLLVTNSQGSTNPPTFHLNGATTNVIAPSFVGWWNDANAAVNIFDWTFDGTRLVMTHIGCAPALGVPLYT